MTTMQMTGERSTTLIAGLFDSAQRAGQVAGEIGKRLEPWQVKVIAPSDSDLSNKVEPETRGIWTTLKGTHVILGGAGMGLGVVAGLVLLMWGTPLFASSPIMTVGACAMYGLFGGLLMAGILSMRPDHDVVTARVVDAAEAQQWAVVTHPLNQAQASEMQSALKDAGGDVVRSL